MGSRGSDEMSWRKQSYEDQKHKKGGGTDKENDENPLKNVAACQVLVPKPKDILVLESRKEMEEKAGGSGSGVKSAEIAGSGKVFNNDGLKLGDKGSGSSSQKVEKKGKYKKLPRVQSRGLHEQSLSSGDKKRSAADMDVDGEEEKKKTRRENPVEVLEVENLNAGLPGQSREQK